MMDNKIKQIVQIALAEDCVKDDITTKAAVRFYTQGAAVIIAKQPSVLCGIEVARYAFKFLNKNINFKVLKKDKAKLKPGDKVAIIKGDFKTILSAERTALNFLSLLSGISTETKKFVEKVKGTGVKILDTRKTTPGLRDLEKYAVKTGDGQNHRKTLADGIIVKDNHLRAAKCISAHHINEERLEKIIKYLRKTSSHKVEVEVESLNEFKAVIEYKPDIIMLDNFRFNDMKKAVVFRNKNFPKIKIEASGGVNLKTVKRIADSGVDYISVGSITHSPQAVDFSLEII